MAFEGGGRRASVLCRRWLFQCFLLLDNDLRFSERAENFTVWAANLSSAR